MKKLFRKKLALMLLEQEQKKKRPYYCEVEYLESTGTQYIDTGLCGTLSSTVDVVFGLSTIEQAGSNNGAIFGGRTGQTSNTFTLFYLASTTPQYFRFDYNGQTQVGTSNTMTFDITSKYNFTYDGSTYKITNLTTNENVSASKAPPISINTSNISLFAVNTNGTIGTYLKGRIYSYKYSDGVNTIDFIPVLDWDMRPAMYDKVSGELFYNAGTGTFSYGREIHRVEYLESTGTQYILAYDGETDDSFGLKMEFSMEAESDNYPAGFSTTNNKRFLFWGARVGVGVWCYGWGTRSTGGTAPNFKLSQYPAGLNNYYTATQNYLNNKKCSFAEDTLHTMSGATDTFTNTNFLLFKSYHTGTKARIKFAILTKGENVIRDFIPAVDENGVGFMFDRVSHTIFDNAGDGAFVYPPVELEYLESDGGPCIDTGIKPTDEYGYRMRNTYRYNGGEQCAIGSMDAGNRFVGVYTGGTQISGGWGSFVGYLKASYKFEDDTIFDVYCNYKNDRQIIVNDEPLKDLTDVHIAGTIANTIYLFARHYGNNITKMYGRIYEVEITKGSDVVAHFIPCIKDGQLGMWDKVNEAFYPNVGTGTFIGGKIVESEEEDGTAEPAEL